MKSVVFLKKLFQLLKSFLHKIVNAEIILVVAGLLVIKWTLLLLVSLTHGAIQAVVSKLGFLSISWFREKGVVIVFPSGWRIRLERPVKSSKQSWSILVSSWILIAATFTDGRFLMRNRFVSKLISNLNEGDERSFFMSCWEPPNNKLYDQLASTFFAIVHNLILRKKGRGVLPKGWMAAVFSPNPGNIEI